MTMSLIVFFYVFVQLIFGQAFVLLRLVSIASLGDIARDSVLLPAPTSGVMQMRVTMVAGNRHNDTDKEGPETRRYNPPDSVRTRGRQLQNSIHAVCFLLSCWGIEQSKLSLSFIWDEFASNGVKKCRDIVVCIALMFGGISKTSSVVLFRGSGSGGVRRYGP